MSTKDKTQEYISVGELSVGFSENIVQPTDALVGKEIKLYYESGKKATIAFKDVEALSWETEEKGPKERFVCFYTAIMPRKDIYFVDFIVSYGGQQVGFHHPRYDSEDCHCHYGHPAHSGSRDDPANRPRRKKVAPHVGAGHF
jgi:hypothetical protein